MSKKKKQSRYIEDRPLLYWLKQATPTEIIVIEGVVGVLSFIYFYLLTKNVIYTSVLIVPPLILTIYLIASNKKRDTIKANSTECMRYINDAVFYLDTNNISQTLELCVQSLNGEVKQDLEKVMNELNQTGLLNLSEFKKYKLPSLDQFHETLQIVYTEGTTDNERTFIPIKDFLLLEIGKQDKLRSSRKGFLNSFNVIQIIVLAMPLSLLYMSSTIYDMFLQSNAVFVVYFAFSIATMLSYIFVTRITADISVRM